MVAKVLAIGEALTQARLPYAFGGALALAWCTGRARGTVDIDLNVFVDAAQAARALEALPAAVTVADGDLERCRRDGQVRLWWGRTPVDVFCDTTSFHRAAADRVVFHRFAGAELAFLSCSDLAVFKAFFNRTKDWADLEEMQAAGTLAADASLGALVHYLGADDERVARLQALTGGTGAG